MAGQRVSTSGTYYSVADAQLSPLPVQQPRPPILVASSGHQLLSPAGREADIIAIGLPPDASEAASAERVSWIREATGDRFSQVELNINLMAIAGQVPRWITARLHLTAQDLVERGSVAALSGTTDQMCVQLIQRRAKLGWSHVLVPDEFTELFSPIVERLAGR